LEPSLLGSREIDIATTGQNKSDTKEKKKKTHKQNKTPSKNDHVEGVVGMVIGALD